jgi:hypothetical protein
MSCQFNRREALRTIGLGTGGALAVMVFTAPACPGGKNLSTYVVIITRSYGEIQTLLPNLGLSQSAVSKLGGFIGDAIRVAEEFDKAYKAGAFDNAATFFNQLGGLATNIASELNVTGNRVVKATLVGIQIARIAIAGLLEAQAANQPAVRTARMSPVMQTAIKEIERLNAIDVSKILVTVQ